MRYFKHRVNHRLKGFDYAHSGIYFITFCILEKHCLLGKIVNEEMVLSNYGMIVRDEIVNTSCIRPNVIIDRSVIMPNHVHLVIKIIGVCLNCSLHEDAPEPKRVGEQVLRLQSPSQTIGSIVRGIKSASSAKIGFSIFQRGYYDTVIRDHRKYRSVCIYVEQNPKRWSQDKFYINDVDP